MLREQKLHPLVGKSFSFHDLLSVVFLRYFFPLRQLWFQGLGNTINYFIYSPLDIYQAKCPHSAILYSICSISWFYWLHQLCRAFDCIWANATMQFLQFIFCVMYPLSNLINKPTHFFSLSSLCRSMLRAKCPEFFSHNNFTHPED